MLNTSSNDSPNKAVQEQDAAIPVIEVTEPVSEKFKEKPDAAETENVLQMIIDQQKSKRKKFIFREGGQQTSGSVEEKGIIRGDSSDSAMGDQN